jgi:hypothetical protein
MTATKAEALLPELVQVHDFLHCRRSILTVSCREGWLAPEDTKATFACPNCLLRTGHSVQGPGGWSVVEDVAYDITATRRFFTIPSAAERNQGALRPTFTR